jgi:hypothetical protein
MKVSAVYCRSPCERVSREISRNLCTASTSNRVQRESKLLSLHDSHLEACAGASSCSLHTNRNTKRKWKSGQSPRSRGRWMWIYTYTGSMVVILATQTNHIYVYVYLYLPFRKRLAFCLYDYKYIINGRRPPNPTEFSYQYQTNGHHPRDTNEWYIYNIHTILCILYNRRTLAEAVGLAL